MFWRALALIRWLLMETVSSSHALVMPSSLLGKARIVAWYMKHYGPAKGLGRCVRDLSAPIPVEEAPAPVEVIREPVAEPEPLPDPAPRYRHYMLHPIGWRLQRVADALQGWRRYKGIVLAPDVADVPSAENQVVRTLEALARHGYLCIILQEDDCPKEIKQVAQGLFRSNLHEDVFAFFAKANVVLYLASPSLRYAVDLFPTSFVVYDLSVSTGHDERLEPHHRELMERAEITLFAQVSAYRQNRKQAYNALLLADGDEHLPLRSPVAPILEGLQRRSGDLQPRTAAQAKARTGRVDIVNNLFFDRSGQKLLKGGAERYVHDLAQLCQSLGYQPRILQNASDRFSCEFRGFAVEGLRVGGDVADTRAVSARLLAEARNADLVIASPLELGGELSASQPLIGINHGVHWDGMANRKGLIDIQSRDFTLNAIEKSRAVVCVDTNFINWVRTEDWDLGRMLHYVPNYVDRKLFHPAAKNFLGPELKLLFPRRLCTERGLHLMMDAFDRLLVEHPEIRLTICGQAVAETHAAVAAFVRRHKAQVEWIERDMDEMGEVYRSHHIVLIPTMASEGTSLSCLEAFASNCAVIATNVGGLPNLVMDGFNGLLIRPKVEDLYMAVQTLASDRQLAERLAENAQATADVFAVEDWQDKWRRIISSCAWSLE